MKIIVGHLYPRMLNLYGDIGNIMALEHRMRARGIEVEVKTFDIDDEIDFSQLDIVFIGGGGEREQLAVCKRLCTLRDRLFEYVENGGVLLAVCGGFEILGKYYKTETQTVEATGILDAYTEYNDNRLIGNIVVESELLSAPVAGFENHNGRVFIGEHTPFGKVLCGHGHSDNGAEGVVYKNLIATYMHGPLLPKNPALTDYLIGLALKNKYGETELSPLDDTAENAAHDYAIGRFLGK